MSSTKKDKASGQAGLVNDTLNCVVDRAAAYGMKYNPPGIPAQLRGAKVRLWSCGWLTPHEDNPRRFKKLPPQEAIKDLPQPYHTAPGMRKTMTHYDRALELCAALNELAGEANGFAVPVHHVDNAHFIYGDVDLHTFDAMNDIQKAAARKAITAFKEQCGGVYWEDSSDGNGAHFIAMRDKCSPQGVIKLDGVPEAVRFMPDVSYIVLTGVNASGTPTTSGEFLAGLTDERPLASSANEFEEDPDKGAEHDSAIIASLPDDEQWQLNHTLQDCGHPSWAGRDGSDRVRSVLRGLLRKTRNLTTTARIFTASTMARYESRSAGMWDLDPLKHQAKLDRIAKSTLNELLRDGYGKPLNLDGLTPPATALDVPKPDAALPTYSALREAAPLEARELFTLFERGIDPAMRFDSYTMITALTAAGAMVGRKYVVNARNRLNYLCLSVSLTGDSGTGKSGYMDALRQLVRMAIDIKPRDLLKAHIVEPNSPRATAELLAATTPQIVVFYFDEYGAAINNTIKADQHMRATQDMLMTAAPQRYVGGELVTKLRNSADTTTKSVKNPCYTVIGGTNSALLWDGLSKADIAGGKLFRNLWVNAEAKPAADIGEKVRRALSADVVEFPQGLVKQLGDLATVWPAIEGQEPQPLQVAYESGRNSEQSLALILESKADYWAERYTLNGQPLAASVYRRMAEFYPRIAAIIAVLRNHRAPVITDEDLQWSFNFVETTMRHWVQNNAQLQQDVNGIDDLAMQAIKIHARVIGLWRNDRQQFEQEYSTLIKGKQLSTACMERGGFNWGAMSRLMPISRTTVRELGYRSKDDALAKLQSHLMTNQLAVIEAVKAPGGGKPSPYIFLTDNAVELLYNAPN